MFKQIRRGSPRLTKAWIFYLKSWILKLRIYFILTTFDNFHFLLLRYRYAIPVNILILFRFIIKLPKKFNPSVPLISFPHTLIREIYFTIFKHNIVALVIRYIFPYISSHLLKIPYSKIKGTEGIKKRFQRIQISRESLSTRVRQFVGRIELLTDQYRRIFRK